MVDFVEEVEERLRAERYARLSRRLAPWFFASLIIVILVWLAAWGWRTLEARDVARASVTYDKAMTALANGDQTGAFTSLEPLATHGPAGYRSLALMLQGNLRLAANNGADAARLFDAAAKAAPNVVFRDLARLRAAEAVEATAPLAQIETRLKPLIGAGKPFDMLAREALADARVQAGQLAQARGDFTAIALSLGASPSMKSRAQTAVALIDSGQAGQIGAITRQAATMAPSAATIPPELLQSGAAGAPGPQGGAESQGDPGTDQ